MMHFKSIAFFLIVFILGSNSTTAQNDWIKFESDGALTFSVDVPGEMEKTTNSFKTAVGELDVVNYAFQGGEDDPNYLYLINMVKYPEGTFPKDSIDLVEEFLNNAIETSVAKVKGELIYSSSIKNGLGKLFRIKYNEGGAIIKGKSFINKDVFISLQVFTIERKSLNDEMDVFLDSFRMQF